MTFRKVIALALLAVGLMLSTRSFADYESSRAWFATLPETERGQIQFALTLLGRYDALIDAQFGRGTYSAIIGYQRSIGDVQDGVLAPAQSTQLRHSGLTRASELGFELVNDPTGVQAFLPTAVLTQRATTTRGTRYSSADGGVVIETIRKPTSEESFLRLYTRLSFSSVERNVTYRHLDHGWFAVSGTDPARTFYLLFLEVDGSSLGFSATWTAKSSEVGRAVAMVVASYFAASEPTEKQPSPPEPPANQVTAEPPAIAARFGSFVLVPGRPEVIRFDGEITPATPLEFLRAVKANPKATRVELNSPGGSVDGALVLAHEIFDRRLSTSVPGGSSCFSACAFVFFAGWSRSVDGQVGVHQIYNQANDLVQGQAKLSDILEALNQFGISNAVLAVMMRTLPADMHIFTPQELDDYGLVTRLVPMNPTIPPAAEAIAPLASAEPPVPVIADNVTVIPKTAPPPPMEVGNGQTERIVTIEQPSALADVLLGSGIPLPMVVAIARPLQREYRVPTLPAGSIMRILMGPSRDSPTMIPYRVSIYVEGQHAATAALNDAGQYVVGKAPAEVRIPEGDTFAVLPGPDQPPATGEASAPGKSQRLRQ